MSLGESHPPEPTPPRCADLPILSGQQALVTGASSGIGRATAIALSAAGADVLVNYVGSREDAEATVAAIRESGRRAIAHRADVSKQDEVLAMFARAREELGTVDILVNNAGIQDDAPLLDMTLEQWERVIRINLTGQFLCAREAVREFCRRGVVPEVSCAAGKIISMSSVHEIIPWQGRVNYAASKGGVKLLMQSIAQESAAWRIRVNSIAPGAIRTKINQDAWQTEEARRELLRLIPYRRIGEPDDIGRLAAWLASDHADYITGQTIVADGGMTLYPGFTEHGG